MELMSRLSERFADLIELSNENKDLKNSISQFSDNAQKPLQPYR